MNPPLDNNQMHGLDSRTTRQTHITHHRQISRFSLSHARMGESRTSIFTTSQRWQQPHLSKAQTIADSLNYEGSQRIKYKNKFAILKVAQADVTLERTAKPKAFDKNGKRVKAIKGEPLPLKLTCTRVEDDEGNLLAK